MAENVPGFRGPVSMQQYPGGQSNPTYLLTTASGEYVLRRKPSGKLLPGAHAVEREHRVISALATTGFPVPDTYGLCEDESVLGTPFYVMEKVDGRIFWDATLPEVAKSERWAHYETMCTTLARLHSIDYEAIGLGDYGKPGSYIERQIAIWSRQYQADEEAGRIEAMDRLCAWLPENVPQGAETTITHGDFRCDNLVFHPGEARVVAVLDWELSTLGHPLADFTYHLMKYRMPDHFPAGIAGRDYEALGLPDEEEYVALYCDLTGRPEIPDLDYYIAFNQFRITAILHGIKGRIIRGNAAGADAEKLVGHLEELAGIAWEQALRAGAAG